MDHFKLSRNLTDEDHHHSNISNHEEQGMDIEKLWHKYNVTDNISKNQTETLRLSKRSILAKPMSKTSTEIVDVGARIGDIFQKINSDSEIDTRFQEVFEKIGKNYDVIDKQYYSFRNREVDLETNVPIKFDSDFMKQTLSTVEQTKNAMHEELSKYLESTSTSNVHKIVSKLDNIVQDFANEVNTFYSLSQSDQISELEEKDGILRSLENSLSFREDSLNTLVFELFNFGYSKPKNDEDEDAFAALSAQYYGSLIYVASTFFLLDLYAQIVNYCYITGDIEEFNTKLIWFKINFRRFKHALIFRIDNDPLLYRVIERFDEVTRKYLSNDKIKQILKERIEIIESIIPKIREIQAPVIDETPEKIRGAVSLKGQKGRIRAPIGSWPESVTVRYALQYKRGDTYSKLGEWSDREILDGVANPYVRVPPRHDATRLVYRKFNKGKPQLVAVLEKTSKTEFRDIDRDIYNAALDYDEDRAINATNIFISHGGDVNKKFDQGRTALHSAAIRGNKKFAQKFLLRNNATDVNVQDINGYTPTHLAAEEGREDFVEFLINNEADVNIGRYSDDLTPLHVAAFEGYEEVAKALLASSNTNVNAKDTEGFTPLHSAIFGRGPIGVRLISNNKNVDVNAKSKQGLTSLHLAAINNYREIAEELLKSQKVDINARAKGQLTALHFAAALGHVDMVKLLSTQMGIDTNAKSIENLTPFHFAILLEKQAVALELLKDSRTNVNLAATGNIAPLHIAATTGQIAVLLKLLEKNPAIEENTDDGLTALHLATRAGQQEIISALVDHGANIEAETNNSYLLTPLKIAKQHNNTAIVSFLKSKGAKRDRRNIKFDRYYPIASGVSKPTSMINSFAQTVISSAMGLSQFMYFPFQPAIDVKYSQPCQNSAVQHIDAASTLFLMDVFVKKITGQSFICMEESNASFIDATAYGLRITEDFEKHIKHAAKESKMSLHSLDIDFVELQKEITRKVMRGHCNEISAVLRLYLEKATKFDNRFCLGKSKMATIMNIRK